MRQIRRLLFCAGALACLAPASWAIGLGPIHSHTQIGQYFHATIPILSARGMGAVTGLKVRLASYRRFKKMGLRYPAALFNLHFRISKEPDGQAVILITSSKPVERPFLTFLLHVQWPSGRLIREYTVLLNPPLLLSATRTPPRVRSVALPPAPVSRMPAPVSRPAPRVARPVKVTERVTPIHHVVGPVRRGQTLWGIASRMATNPGETDQMMMALYRRNPYAFSGNINRLRQGAVLKVPPRSTIHAIPVREAIAFVSAQDRTWRTSGLPTQAGTRSGLVLLTPSGHLARQATAVKGPAEVASLKKTVSRQRTQVAQLTAKLKASKNRVQSLEHLLTLKNQALATLARQKAGVHPPARTTSSGFGLWPWIVAILILALLVALAMRQRAQRAARAPAGSRELVNNPPQAARDPDAFAAESLSDTDGETQGPPAHDEASGMDLEEKKAEEEVFDPFTDVNFQIAYALYDRAIETLQEWLEQNPDQRAVHLKLLEVYAAAERPKDYIEASRRFRDRFGTDHADWAGIAEQGRRLAPAEPLFSASGPHEVQAPVSPEPSRKPQERGASSPVEDIFDELMGTPELPADETLEFGSADTGTVEPLYREADIGSDTNTELRLEFELAEFDPEKKRASTTPPGQTEERSATDAGLDTHTHTQKQFDESLAILAEHTGTTFTPGVGGETLVNTKLDLAKAYMEMGDRDSARSILDEVLEEGTPAQKSQAQELIRSLKG